MKHPSRQSNDWTEERTKRAKKLWLDGFSAGEIALKIDGGFSRSAIVAKMHREGLSGRGQPLISKRRQKKQRKSFGSFNLPSARALPSKPASEPHVDAPPSLGLTVLQLTESTCKWPHGDGRPTWNFCGQPSLETSPYCAYHDRAARAA